jgi:hypothetical protein
VAKVAIAGVVVLALGVGLGVGLVLGGRGDDSSGDHEAIVDRSTSPDGEATPSTTEPSADQGGEADDPFGDPSLDDLLSDLPEDWQDLLPDDLRDDLSDLSDLEDLDVPGGVQVTIVFAPGAPRRQVNAIQDAFERSDLLSFVQFLSAEELDEFTGGPPIPPSMAFDTLTAFARSGTDPEEARAFGCSFADEPAVAFVQIFGGEPCGQSA